MARTRPVLLSVAVGLVAFAVYFASYGGVFHSAADEWLMFASTESLAKRAEPSIDQLFWVGEWGGLARFGVDGHLYNKYTNFSTGQTLAGIPLYAATRLLPDAGLAQGTLLTNGVIVSGLLALLLLTLTELGYSRATAVATSLAFGFGSSLWPYAETYFGEPLLGLGCLSVVYCLIRERNRLIDQQSPGAGAGWLREVWVITAGLALAATILTKPAGALMAPFAAGYLLYLRRSTPPIARLRMLIYLGLPTALLGAVIFYMSAARFGLGEGLLHSNAFTTPLWWGLYGLLLSPGRSIFLYSPVVLLGVFGLRALWRSDRAFALTLIGFLGAYFCFFAQWNDWHGGPYVWGPRFLVAVTALFAIPAASLFEAGLRRRGLAAIAVAVIVAAGVAVQVPAVVNDYLPVMLEIQSHYGPLGPNDLFDRLQSFSNLQMVPILLMWQTLSVGKSDIAWLALGDAKAAALSIALVLLSLAVLFLVYRFQRAPSRGLLLAGMLLFTVASVGVLLPRYVLHPHYGPWEYRIALEQFEREASPGAALVTLDVGAHRAFNYQRLPNRRYGLPADSFDPWDSQIARLLDEIVRSHDTVWVLATGDKVGKAEAWLRERSVADGESRWGETRLVRLRPILQNPSADAVKRGSGP